MTQINSTTLISSLQKISTSVRITHGEDEISSAKSNPTKQDSKSRSLEIQLANRQSAESVIRDLSSAKTFTLTTREKILDHNRYSMVAQANQASQNVLELLAA